MIVKTSGSQGSPSALVLLVSPRLLIYLLVFRHGFRCQWSPFCRVAVPRSLSCSPVIMCFPPFLITFVVLVLSPLLLFPDVYVSCIIYHL